MLVKPVTPQMLLDAALQKDGALNGAASVPARGAHLRRLHHMHVLVVEDNLLNQQIAEELLCAEGAVVSLAANGQLGVDAIAAAIGKRQFDAVLMDIQMPVMDGFVATGVVRNTLHLRDLPIIAMTANASASDRDECLAAGMNAHIGKPFDLDNLVQTLLEVSGFQPDADPPASPQANAGVAEQAADMHYTELDVKAALNRMGGLSSLYVRAARAFIQTLPEEVDAIASEVASAAPQAAARAHTLKGIAATLGANVLANVAAQMEELAKKGAVGATLENTLQRLRQAAAQARIALAAVADSMDEKGPDGQHDDADAKSAMDALIRLLENDDLTALAHYAQVKHLLAAYPPAAMDRLEAALQDLDLESALAVCRGIPSSI
jgi:CheY-like chemotaxis protein